MSGIYGSGPKGKATKLHAILVRSRGRCERCGDAGPNAGLQCAHIVSRRFSATRTDERNAWCLCASCHRFLTTWQHEHVAFAHETIGVEAFDELVLRAKSNDRPWKPSDWQAEVDRLNALISRSVA